MGHGIHNAGEAPEYCVNNVSDSSPANSAFKPIHELKIKSEGDGGTEVERQSSGTPPPSIALTPLSANKAHHSHKSKSGKNFSPQILTSLYSSCLVKSECMESFFQNMYREKSLKLKYCKPYIETSIKVMGAEARFWILL